MKTWWIIKEYGEIIISPYGDKTAIGPYWSCDEALLVALKWSK